MLNIIVHQCLHKRHPGAILGVKLPSDAIHRDKINQIAKEAGVEPVSELPIPSPGRRKLKQVIRDVTTELGLTTNDVSVRGRVAYCLNTSLEMLNVQMHFSVAADRSVACVLQRQISNDFHRTQLSLFRIASLSTTTSLHLRLHRARRAHRRVANCLCIQSVPKAAGRHRRQAPSAGEQGAARRYPHVPRCRRRCTRQGPEGWRDHEGSDVLTNSAKVTSVDNNATNGVVYIIDSVLIPAGPAPAPPGPPGAAPGP